MKSSKKCHYLNKSYSLSSLGRVKDYCTSSNIDENYAQLYPNLGSEEVRGLVSRYPINSYTSLEKSLRKQFGGRHFCFGAGSEDLIVRINKCVVKTNEKVVVLEPIFYRVIETLATKDIVPATSKRLHEKIKGSYVWLANPNTLSGELVQQEAVLGAVIANPKTVFIVDEASIFFLKDWRNYSLMPLAHKHPNLVVLSSLSKFHGLPGGRVGFACSSRLIVNKLRSAGPTFPVSAISVHLAVKALNNEKFFRRIRARIGRHKQEVLQLLKGSPITAEGSCANTVFAHCSNGVHLPKLLAEYKIGVLDLNTQVGNSKPDYVRLTVHSSKKKQRFLMSQLKSLLKEVV